MVPVLFAFSETGLLALRLVAAAIFLAHGWPKLKSIKTTQQNFGMMGFRPGWLWGTIVALLEGLGGPLLLIGFLVQPLGVLLAFQMVVATFWKLKQGQKFVNGYELDLLLVAALLVLATAGAGALSVDNYFRLF